MDALARKGIMCVLLKMPLNLAVLDVDGAEGIQEMYPEIESWYIGGHSLGGSMAASYLSKNISEYEGLILLGSYSTTDLSNERIRILSVYGSEDKVMNKEKYDEYKKDVIQPIKIPCHIVINGVTTIPSIEAPDIKYNIKTIK